MKLYIGSSIEIFEPTPEILQLCESELVVDNPEYLTALRLGKWTGNIPKRLYLYERNGDRLIVPYGFKNRLGKISHMWEKYPPISSYSADYNSTINLYDYQEIAVNKMIKAINGVVVMPCGGGKTQVALECVARLGLKTLWLTHTQDLLNQSMERAKMCFDCDSDMFGTISAGKVNISKGITFATVQTMCKLDLSLYRDKWAVIVVDECQHCCGSPTRVSQFYRVINNLYAPYKFGLTATPNRADGLESSMYSLIGDKIIEIDRERVSDKTCKVKVKSVNTNYYPNGDYILNGDGTINYTLLIDDLINDNERFLKAIVIINNECRCYSMVLANRVAYLQKLNESYSGKSICLSRLGTSNKAKQERKEALRKLNDGEIDCIFATYQLAAEGLDCPNLRYVVFATPEKNERLITQAVGRVARKADGKEYGTVIDLVDDFGMYKSWHKVRNRVYKRLNCDIEKN